jgi:hypothetical protein
MNGTGGRFTTVNGAHFLIAANGEEAYPTSAAESSDFRDLCRRTISSIQAGRRATRCRGS